MNNNYQNGGWYNNPQTGKNQQYWNGQWFDTPQQGNNQTTNPLDLFNSYNSQAQQGVNNYVDQQEGIYQKNHDLQSTLLNSQNTQALGTQDQNAQTNFLNSVLNPQQAQEGSLQYGYGLTQGNENNVYGLNTTANQQNRDLALSKLANDENWATQNLNLNQGNANASKIDELNGRGLLYGQTPTGAFQGQPMGGMNGAAGQQAGRVNTDFGNQRGQLQTTYGLNTQGVNQDWQQQQNMLNQSHQFNTAENQFNTANSINQQNNQFGYQTGMNNNQLQMYKNSLENERAQNSLNASLQAKIRAQQQGGITYQ